MTTTRRRVPTSQPAPPANSYSEWRSGTGKVLKRGDVVRCTGRRGRYIVQWFRAEQNGNVAVVIGGEHGHRNYHAFTVDRLTIDRRATKENQS